MGTVHVNIPIHGMLVRCYISLCQQGLWGCGGGGRGVGGKEEEERRVEEEEE